MTTYSMSGVGACSKVLAAQRLDYAPTPQTQDDLARLSHYTALEQVAANQIQELRIGELETGGACHKCGRSGIHVQHEDALFSLTGHLDRRIRLYSDDRTFPIEIKSLGKSSFNRFLSKHFDAFQEYAAQEACYLHVENKPGLYWIMERDSGINQKYIVNDFKNELNLPGFEKLELPVTFDSIIDKLNDVEIAISDFNTFGKLPEAQESESCFFCNYRYLCIKSEKKSKAVTVTMTSIIEAATEYSSCLQIENDTKNRKAIAKDILLQYAKSQDAKFHAGNISVTYNGMTSKKSWDSVVLRKVLTDEELRLSYKDGELYDDIDIRRLKSKDE